MNIRQSSRLSTSRDYLALLVRRKWLILFSFLGCLGLALLTVSVIPNVYVSETLILFRPSDVSTDLVKEITNGTADQRLTAIQETILSRSNLLKIIREFEHEASPYRELSDEKKVAKMRGQLGIEFFSEKVRNVTAPVTHVRIRYSEQDPELAQRIAARLASLFITQENSTREQQVQGTARFLQGELARVTERLTESGERLKAIKQRYRDELPSQLEANLRTLDRLQEQKTASAEALERQKTLQLTLERQLSQTSPRITRDMAFTETRERNPLLDIYLKKEQEYNDMVAKATDKHPDVIRLKSELELLRTSIAAEDLDSIRVSDQPKALARTEVNPLYQSLMAQLSQVKTEIEIQKREKVRIERQIGESTVRVQNTPRAEQEIAAIERSNSELAKQADDLRAKLEEAKLSESVQSREQSSQFVVVDPANRPEDPAFPNRAVLRLSGVGLSFFIALAAGIITDLSKRRIFTSFELERLLTAPVLVEIPRIAPAWQTTRMRRTKLKYAMIFLFGAGVYVWGLYHLYSHQSYLLRVLDPLIIQTTTGSANAQK